MKDQEDEDYVIPRSTKVEVSRSPNVNVDDVFIESNIRNTDGFYSIPRIYHSEINKKPKPVPRKLAKPPRQNRSQDNDYYNLNQLAPHPTASTNAVDETLYKVPRHTNRPIEETPEREPPCGPLRSPQGTPIGTPVSSPLNSPVLGRRKERESPYGSQTLRTREPTPERVLLPTATPPLAVKRTTTNRSGAQQKAYQRLYFSIDDTPPWYICLLLGFQHYIIMFGATVANPLALTDKLCIQHNDYATKSHLVGTIFVMSGIATFLQSTFGVRLPIVQGGSFTFIGPLLGILSSKERTCPTLNTSIDSEGLTMFSLGNYTASNVTVSPLEDGDPEWKVRMREVQGAIMLASVLQILVGFTGVMGWMLRFIGPLAIAPTIALAGLALFTVAEERSSKQWWVTLSTVVLIIAFSQYTKHVKIPCFAFQRGKGFRKRSFPVFRLFPVMLAVLITWLVCAILTATHVFPPESSSRGANTNINIEVLHKAPWFRMPYPGQWGMPTLSVASVFGMLAAVLANMVESVGDYYACARMSRVPPPPMHAVNRGIGVEGIGCLLAGAFGTGSGTTSYSENIGAIGITKVASRRVIQMAALIMVIFGIFSKFGAIFVTIPDPIIGGVFIVMFGMIVAVGISNLQFVDLNSSRNLFIIGFSFFFGLTLPGFLHKNPKAIQTGNNVIDQILTVLLKTSMFVGGFSGFVLDNTIPGTKDERGIIKWRLDYDGLADGDIQAAHNTMVGPMHNYELPFVSKFLRKWQWTKYIPFLPTFNPECASLCKSEESVRRRRNFGSRDNLDTGTAV